MTVYTATLNGYAFGCDQEWDWDEVLPSGIGPGEYRGGRVATQGRDGERPTGSDQSASGRLSFDLVFMSTASSRAADAELAAQRLRAAFAPVEGVGLIELTVELASGTYVLRGRPMSPATDLGYAHFGFARARVVFEALDPLWYSQAPGTAFVTMPTSTEGLVVASGGVTVASGGVTLTGPSAASDAAALNTGTAPAHWTATISGPILNPKVSVAGGLISLNIDLLAGESITLDSRTRAVYVGGVARPIAIFGSRWQPLPANVATTFSIRGESGTGSARLTWRSATR